MSTDPVTLVVGASGAPPCRAKAGTPRAAHSPPARGQRIHAVEQPSNDSPGDAF